jgi:ATP-dependent Lon protease
MPGSVLTLALDRDEVRAAVHTAMAADGRLVLVAAGVDLGVIARVPNIGNLPGGQPAAIVQAESRATIAARHAGDRGVDHVDVEMLTDGRPTPRVEAAVRDLRAVLEEIATLRGSRRLPEALRSVTEPGALADVVAAWSDDDDLKRAVLAAQPIEQRVSVVDQWARTHLAELQVATKIRNDVSDGVDKQQREYLLRQQLAAIRKELGEGDDDVAASYRATLDELRSHLPDAAATHIAKEIDRLERMSGQSPEHSWVRTWLDRVLELPWATRTHDSSDLAEARARLDADHHGLEDVKERIIEFLAVRSLRRQNEAAPAADAALDRRPGAGTIVTLVGPPGVGKTSLGESIAAAMGRNFVRVALGGVRDEAEIRGHRRTYVGSQPGRIVRAMHEAGSMNPVILLDEVDKLGSGGWSGDPTAALLEVLDPAQNHTFRDHYLEIDLDLSDVVFIATANVLDSIPGPLLDRMEVVRLDGYTEDEKVFIATRYLLPRQARRAGLADGDIAIDDDALRAVIAGYTREAGVRGLERELGKLARKVAAQVVTTSLPRPVVVGSGEVRRWLGRQKIDDAIPERTDTPGIATGLAVTGMGGDVLFIETTAFELAQDGEPTLTLTGQLGDVMKESAQIALSYVRSHADELGVRLDDLHKRVHVHVPAGAVPKDGPSAGITMTTALVSLLTGRTVKATVGMTGEITLQGKVLPIGGVKQKVLAAHRAGLTDVVLPKRNGPDLEDVPQSVRDRMTFHLADTYLDVLAAAF